MQFSELIQTVKMQGTLEFMKFFECRYLVRFFDTSLGEYAHGVSEVLYQYEDYNALPTSIWSMVVTVRATKSQNSSSVTQSNILKYL